MTVQILDKKIFQMHAALEGLKDRDFTGLRFEGTVSKEGFHCNKLDFNKGATEAELANIATLLINNIACIKDHLKAWCNSHSAPFEGEELINSNPDVAIIHDLWNIEKHGGLDRPPRSGHIPSLHNLQCFLSLKAGPWGYAKFTMPLGGGIARAEASAGGSVDFLIDAAVVDKDGAILGNFNIICERAIAAWEKALSDAGVPLPDR